MIKTVPKVALFSEKSKRNSRTKPYENPIAGPGHSSYQLPKDEQFAQRFERPLRLGAIASIYKDLCKGGNLHFRRRCDEGDQQL